jgi:hypothetical protein
MRLPDVRGAATAFAATATATHATRWIEKGTELALDRLSSCLLVKYKITVSLASDGLAAVGSCWEEAEPP